jgi:hypothetical protein
MVSILIDDLETDSYFSGKRSEKYLLILIYLPANFMKETEKFSSRYLTKKGFIDEINSMVR